MDEINVTDRQQKMLDLTDEIIFEWVEQLRTHISEAKNLPDPLLMNTLPSFYRILVGIATSSASVYERSTVAVEHGGERARLTHYDTQTIVNEYRLFRDIVFSIWCKNGINLSQAEVTATHKTIDEALAEAISGFVMVEQRFREQFFAALAHDMRTPLSTAAMAVEMICQAEAGEKIHAMARIASKQHNLLKQMINDLLDTVVVTPSNHVASQLKPTNMHALAEEVASAAQLTHGRTVIVQGEAFEGLWHTNAIRRAIENMVNNAIKYGKANTDIIVEVHQTHGRCTVAVENSGPPIPVEQQENIFQLFRRSEQAVQENVSGWGIGLPYVRSVAEQHGGSVSVKCTDVKTTFILDIPIDPRPILKAKQDSQ